MAKITFRELLAGKKILVSDGGTGSSLIQRGLPRGIPPEKWVLENPQAILDLHQEFINAGAEVILTCSFGASKIRLEAFGLGDQFHQINQKAVNLAKKASGESEVLVAGSLGPLGQKLNSYGKMNTKETEVQYRQQAEILSTAGVDLLLVETQYNLEETEAAVCGAQAASDLPLIVSFSFSHGISTSPVEFAHAMRGKGLTAIGINCGHNLPENLKALNELSSNTNLPIWFKPNTGLPNLNESGRPVYDVSPEDMGAQVPGWIEAGARIIGGCCGSSPAHLKAMAEQVKRLR